MFTRLRPVIAVCALALALGGCATSPHPAEPPPAFSSEAEAFAAAEETYRAYVDALNQVDLSDPATFEAVYAWTTGEANANERRSFSEMHAAGLTVSGISRYDAFNPVSFAASEGVVIVELCMDVSDVDLLDQSQTSVVPGSRPDLQPAVVTFHQSDATATGLWISSSVAKEDASCG
ncbi:hypothetical protein ACFC3F_02660 [Microbacterium sp. NPDC055910]|uniref:hypothetical protein n=1 Tax=Microbacterium sp. NPDC055910 TaxID=3345659 RepID=UPI0035E051E3